MDKRVRKFREECIGLSKSVHGFFWSRFNVVITRGHHYTGLKTSEERKDAIGALSEHLWHCGNFAEETSRVSSKAENWRPELADAGAAAGMLPTPVKEVVKAAGERLLSLAGSLATVEDECIDLIAQIDLQLPGAANALDCVFWTDRIRFVKELADSGGKIAPALIQEYAKAAGVKVEGWDHDSCTDRIDVLFAKLNPPDRAPPKYDINSNEWLLGDRFAEQIGDKTKNLATRRSRAKNPKTKLHKKDEHGEWNRDAAGDVFRLKVNSKGQVAYYLPMSQSYLDLEP